MFEECCLLIMLTDLLMRRRANCSFPKRLIIAYGIAPDFSCGILSEEREIPL